MGKVLGALGLAVNEPGGFLLDPKGFFREMRSRHFAAQSDAVSSCITHRGTL
jgi:hypothetical protein